MFMCIITVYTLCHVGKTRTIAALVDILTAQKKRILIIAPANAASRRVLESIVNTGYEDACLVVSTEYFYEWHETAYDGGLGKYVHTKEYLFDKAKKAGMHQKKYHGHDPDDRAAHDFKARESKQHQGKWTSIAVDGLQAGTRLPSVLIGTFGCITGAVTSPNGQWATQVNNLLNLQSIDALIVDETSQLWSGYSLALLPSLRQVQNIILVGDSNQLAPYGVDDIKCMKSLFDEGLCHSSVPHTTLTETFRLSPIVASVISSKIYNDQLQVRRSPENEVKFYTYLDTKIKTHLRNPTSLGLIQRMLAGRADPEETGSLAWIHNSNDCYQHPESKSSGNDHEARLVAAVASDLIKAIHNSSESAKGELHVKLTILTPYLEVYYKHLLCVYEYYIRY